MDNASCVSNAVNYKSGSALSLERERETESLESETRKSANRERKRSSGETRKLRQWFYRQRALFSSLESD